MKLNSVCVLYIYLLHILTYIATCFIFIIIIVAVGFRLLAIWWWSWKKILNCPYVFKSFLRICMFVYTCLSVYTTILIVCQLLWLCVFLCTNISHLYQINRPTHNCLLSSSYMFARKLYFFDVYFVPVYPVRCCAKGIESNGYTFFRADPFLRKNGLFELIVQLRY